jgi:hypothetical protein
VSWESHAFGGLRVALVAAGVVVALVLALKIAVLLLEPRLTFFPPPSAP